MLPEACVGLCADCDGEAVMRVDTSNGYIKPEPVCRACAAYLDNYSGPDESDLRDGPDYAWICEQARAFK